MKTSNILMVGFLLVTLAMVGYYSNGFIKKIDAYKERIKTVRGSKSNMTLYNTGSFSRVSVDGSKELKVLLKCTGLQDGKVWVETTYKDSVKVNVDKDILYISSSLLKEQAIVVVEVGSLSGLSVNNSDVQVDKLIADTLSVSLSGNAYAVVKSGSAERVKLKGVQNGNLRAARAFSVKFWDIALSNNARVSGISPNSKLNMNVTENGKVDLLNSYDE